jgi:Ca2+-binding EF-hand superfamily protein
MGAEEEEQRNERTEARLAELSSQHIRPTQPGSKGRLPALCRSNQVAAEDTALLPANAGGLTVKLPGDEPRAKGGVMNVVGLKVDPKTRGLVAAAETRPKPHKNIDAAKAAGVPLWLTIENSMAWEWFKELDDDSSGVLDEHEALQLCHKLKLKIKNFDKVFKELDDDGSGEVTFAEFVNWFNERKSSERREMRLAIRDLFEKIDKDRSGKLSKTEIGQLVKKSKGKLNLIGEPFDVEQDWDAMHKTGGPEVCFPCNLGQCSWRADLISGGG